MTTIQPILAIALAILCVILSEVSEGTKRFCLPSLWTVAGYVILLILSSVCAIRFGHIDDHRAVIVCIAVGGITSVLSVILSNLFVGTSIALAVSGACAAHLVRADNFPEIGLAFAYSICVGSVFFGAYPGVAATAVVGGVISMTDYMGKEGGGSANRAYVGVALGLALTVAAVITVASRKIAPKALGRLEGGLATVLAAMAGYVVSRWAVGGDLWIILGIASVAAYVVHCLIPQNDEPQSFRVGVATIIWIALGTIGFSLLKGFGMACGILEGVFVLVLLGNARAILTIGPVLGLLMYRVLRDASPDSSRALDIGQHYGVTGIIVGASIPMLYAEWFACHRSGKPALAAISGLLWSFVLISLPVLAITVLGAKGASGIVVGLGLCGFLLAGTRLPIALPLAIAVAAGSVNVVAVDWIGEAMDYTRQQKLHTFGWWTLAMTLAAIGILAVTRREIQGEKS